MAKSSLGLIYKKRIKYRDYLREYGLKWPLLSLLRFEKLIGFNIKNLKLYIEQDSSNKLKGEFYGMACTCRCNRNSVLFKSVKISKIN